MTSFWKDGAAEQNYIQPKRFSLKSFVGAQFHHTRWSGANYFISLVKGL